ncbi:hypothetical protein [Neptunicella marina]|uniref:Uncharacterized protein n=1 Tax=Neptunicella marina TaxID=2125989 RepID=A0A8J6IVI8_9ALTE|nr:hypothetical protein [Neptunicella marina]MBC3766667.1 hypothetical protein [Neptunicella marina]
MSAKKIWISWLSEQEDPVLQQTLRDLQSVGLLVSGAPFIDDLEKCAWTELAEHLCAEPDIWLIGGTPEQFAQPSVRYALSLISLNLSINKPALPVFVFNAQDQQSISLPPLCHNFTVLTSGPGWAAKVVAGAYSNTKNQLETGVHVNMIAQSAIGQWFELGPEQQSANWQGAMFGIPKGQGEILFQAVGQRGQLPDKTVNEYPMNGIELEINGDEYVACALKNTVSDQQAYYIKVKGFPSNIIIGDHPETADAEVHCIQLS